MNKIICKNIKVTYILKKKQFIDGLNGLSISFSSKKINILFGRNGCGKSTLFNCITGILPYDGEIFFNDRNAKELSVKERHISYVQQSLTLFPKMTVFDNLAYPLKNLKLPQQEIMKRIYEICILLEIPHLINCLPKQISIGQFQKVCIAKALISNPKVIILDEAFSNLDPTIIKVCQKALKDYVVKNDAILIYVGHNIKEALEFGDYFYIIDNSKILFEGKKDSLNEEIINKYILESAGNELNEE